jgi:hypothetical protein
VFRNGGKESDDGLEGNPAMPPIITHYAFGSITIDGETYRSDVIVLPDRVVPDWWRKRGHRLAIEDLREVLADAPATLVVGTGASGAMAVPAETIASLKRLGVEVIVEPTGDAVRTYNRLAPGGRVAAGLHLTC